MILVQSTLQTIVISKLFKVYNTCTVYTWIILEWSEGEDQEGF